MLAIVLMSLLYCWSFYNLPIVLAGMRKAQRKFEESTASRECFHFVSIIVPAKNEGTVIDRCLESLMSVDYPRNRFEVLVVEDGCFDNTVSICNDFVLNLIL